MSAIDMISQGIAFPRLITVTLLRPTTTDLPALKMEADRLLPRLHMRGFLRYLVGADATELGGLASL